MNKNISLIISVFSALVVIIGGSISYGQMKQKTEEIDGLKEDVGFLKQESSGDTVRFEYIQTDLSEIKGLIKEMSKTHYEV